MKKKRGLIQARPKTERGNCIVLRCGEKISRMKPDKSLFYPVFPVYAGDSHSTTGGQDDDLQDFDRTTNRT